MKKLLILSFLFISLNSFSQVFNVKATQFYSRSPGYAWSLGTPVYLDVNVNFNTQRVTIYSEDVQLLDFVTLNESYIDNGVVYSGYATDTKYVKVFIRFYIMTNNSMFFEVNYSDFEYMYKLEE